MIISTIKTADCTPQTIVIGRRATYETLQVVFDLSYLAETYGSGVAVLVVKRSQDETAYPATITQEGNTLTWTISETDTYYVGAGECELMWYVNNGLAKTIIYPVVVMRDILQTAEEPPDAYENWIEHLTELGAETQQHALDAAQSATESETAQGKAEDAQSAAENAQEAAEEAARKAEESSVHAPIIVNGYWYAWNATTETYQNTGVKAEGHGGTDGFSPVITVTDITGGHRVTITDADGTQTVDVMNGTDGDDGFSPTVTITEITGGHRVTITDKTHPSGQIFDVMDGVIQSVNGKSAASITLDSGDIEFDDSETYAAGSIGAEVSNQKNAISELTGMIYSGNAANGDVLFTSDDVSVGNILYCSMTANSSAATFVELLDSENQRVGLFGKIASLNGVLKNTGVIVVPTGFASAVLRGGNATIHYLQKQFPNEMVTDIQNQYIGGNVNLLDGVQWENKKGIRLQDGVVENATSGVYISGYLAVIPKSKITVDFNIGSIKYCTGFYDAKLGYVNGIPSNAENKEFYVPDGAYFVMFTMTSAAIAGNPHAYITLPQTAQTDVSVQSVNFYERHIIHKFGTLFNGSNGYLHVGFPRMCYFAGKTVMVYRTGYQHMPTTNNTLPAVQQMDVRESDGTWKHIKSFSASDFTGATGDARDWYIQPSRDGQYLLMVGGFSHYVSGTVYYDCFVAVLNTSLEIVDYQLFLNNDYYFFGNPLVTPDGHIIFTYFKRGATESGIYRSEEVFNGTVSALTFTRTALNTESSSHSECCLGYFNSKLVLMQRYEDSGAAKLMATSDLEGLTGWSSPMSVQISIHSPFLLPYYKGKYLPVVGSRFFTGSPQNRQPYLYYIDIDTFTPVAYGDIDPSLLTAYNGYPTFVPLGGENYAVAYYQESPSGTDASYPSVNTAIYYKWINAREILPQATYLDL